MAVDGGDGECGGAVDHLLQLTDIAGPRLILEHSCGVVGERERTRAGPCDKMSGERSDIADSFGEGWDDEHDSAQTMTEVGAEPADLDQHCKLLVRRGD